MSDKPDYGKGSTPGYFCVLPQRAVVDIRFKDHPAVFRVLAALGNYTSRQGVCWPNQITIARDLHLTQSTVSRHIKKLIEWGYIKYAKKHPGLKGNKYFMVFDPEIQEADAQAIATAQDRSFTEKPEIPAGPLTSQQKKKPTCGKPVNKPNKNNPSKNTDIHSDTYSDMHSELIHNNITNNTYIPIARNVLQRFVRMSEEIYGIVVVFTDEHVNTLASWINAGLDPEYAVKRIRHIIKWRRDNNLDSPKTINFFKDALLKPKTVSKQDRATKMLNSLGRKLKRTNR